ncbi:restriction endonuclease subunit S domain-containing protein [Haloarcula sp. H-GB5]
MEAFSLGSDSIEDRLDATHYLPTNRRVVKAVEESGMEVCDLGDLSSRVFYPGRFSRNYVAKDLPYIEYDNSKPGQPFVTPSEAKKNPEIRRVHRLSASQEVPEYVLEDEDWILVTRSGTVGVTVRTNELKGVIGSEDFIRVVADEDDTGHYLYAFLNSEYGRPQLKMGAHGSVIEHLRPESIEQVRVPLPEEESLASIAQQVGEAMEDRRSADSSMRAALSVFSRHFDIDGERNETSSERASFVVESTDIEDRLDANYYLPQNRRIVAAINDSDYETTTVGHEADQVFYPPRFRRNYVAKDVPFLSRHKQEGGVPYLKPSEAKKVPEARRLNYLSESTSKLDRYLLKDADWFVVTRSGTVGTTLRVGEDYEGFAASEHLIRVAPSEERMGKYLYAFMLHHLGKSQLKMGTHGSVVKEITPDHVEEVVVPVLPGAEFDEVVENIDDALEHRRNANEKISDAISRLEDALPDTNEIQP